jgi:hypothetical protein
MTVSCRHLEKKPFKRPGNTRNRHWEIAQLVLHSYCEFFKRIVKMAGDKGRPKKQVAETKPVCSHVHKSPCRRLVFSGRTMAEALACPAPTGLSDFGLTHIPVFRDFHDANDVE